MSVSACLCLNRGEYYLDADAHPEVEEDQKAEWQDEEEEGGKLVKRVVLKKVSCISMDFFKGILACG